jgi:nitrogen fixation NifU-like protein
LAARRPLDPIRMQHERIQDHLLNPRNPGELEEPDAEGREGTPGEGPYMVIQLQIRDGRVTEARFQTYGCGPAIASASVLTEMITDKTLDECRALEAGDIIRALDGIPPGKEHCPELAIRTLRRALDDYRSRQGA